MLRHRVTDRLRDGWTAGDRDSKMKSGKLKTYTVWDKEIKRLGKNDNLKVSFQFWCFTTDIMAEKGRQGKDGRIKRQRKAKETDRWIASQVQLPSLDVVLNAYATLPSHTQGLAPYCLSIPCSLSAPTISSVTIFPYPHLKISEPLFACPILSPTNSKKLSYCSSPYSAPSLLNS